MVNRIHSKIGTFRQLEILLTVYEQGSIKKASDALHLTQPTVSMQLKKLSQSIDAPLYDQVGKKLIFTQAGIIMANAARDTLERMHVLDGELSALRGLKTGTLKIAVVTTSKYFIPHLLGPFCQRYPDIEIEFNVGNRQTIINRLQAGHDDFYVFSHLPDNIPIDAIEFVNNPLVMVAAENHPLTKRNNIDLSELTEEPFLMRESGSGTRFAIERFLAASNVKMNIKMTIESNEAIRHCVMAGLGVSILSEHTLAFNESEGLAILDVKQLPILSKWFLVKVPSKTLSPIAKMFLNYLEIEGQDILNRYLSTSR